MNHLALFLLLLAIISARAAGNGTDQIWFQKQVLGDAILVVQRESRLTISTVSNSPPVLGVIKKNDGTEVQGMVSRRSGGDLMNTYRFLLRTNSSEPGEELFALRRGSSRELKEDDFFVYDVLLDATNLVVLQNSGGLECDIVNRGTKTGLTRQERMVFKRSGTAARILPPVCVTNMPGVGYAISFNVSSKMDNPTNEAAAKTNQLVFYRDADRWVPLESTRTEK